MKLFLAEDMKKLNPRARETLKKFRIALDEDKLGNLTRHDIDTLVNAFEDILPYVK